ncbi:hypothetical protein SISNIDRAFT_446421 [Sistotremastrum niveocremeum HHB9708]|uniref:Ferritin-like domain-containing protein n=2 Tax=Sistotremastraceae TaxID=3402574 RepID=A0A164NQ73_9AGAM|nr:hypothetical protein SISNIDRAFT_446421 [Sistotremastrum niveocremeum HHB9708]KZT32894.1 hypothetical protein SISSUDRAFT_1011422 [Sistotremastrum suecicum HHB10207 ss-3]
MKFATLFASSLVVAASALPAKRDTAPTEIEVLQFALTLEHLEDNFYKTYLGQYDAKDFDDAGYPDWVHGRVAQIGQHESEHVQFLSDAIGPNATAACEYTFPVTDVHSFLAVSQLLEGVGVTAYLGAAQFLTTKAYITAAAAILTTEARHNAWLGSAEAKGAPWSGAFDTPQTVDEVYSLAAPFIKSCPASNPALPVKAFPTLSIATAGGNKLQLTFDGPASGYLVFMTGLRKIFVPIASDKTVTLPNGLQGVVYAIVSQDGTTVSDDTTTAGPAVLDYPFDSYASNPQ